MEKNLGEYDRRKVNRTEVERILALPTKTFVIAGMSKTGKYDENHKKFYLLDKDQKLSGKVITIRETEPQKAPEPSSDDEAKKDNGSSQNAENKEIDTKDGENSKSTSAFLRLKSLKIIPNQNSSISASAETTADGKSPDLPQNSRKSSVISVNRVKDLNVAGNVEIRGKASSDDSDDSGKKASLSKMLFIIIAAVVVVGAVTAGASIGLSNSSKTTSTNDTTVATATAEPAPAVTDDTAAAAQTSGNAEEPVSPDTASENLSDTVEVISVTKTLIPGDVVTEDILQIATISREAYDSSGISSTGSRLYLAEVYDLLIGLYATDYISEGQYLTYANVSAVAPTYTNPWIVEQEGYVYVYMPVTEEDIENGLTFGSILNAQITKTTSVSKPVVDTETTEGVDGLTHEQTVQEYNIVDTYSLSALTVCDLINANMESTYAYYAKYSTIPAGIRVSYFQNALVEDETLLQTLTPAYALVMISAEQSAALGDMASDNISVSMSIYSSDTSSAAKVSFAGEATSIRTAISEAQNAIELAAAESTEEPTDEQG